MISTPATPISLLPGETRRESKRILELEGLRGLAIFVVIICHYIADSPVGLPHRLATQIIVKVF